MRALLLAERPVWLLDEPTASLDEGAQRTLTEVVERHLAPEAWWWRPRTRRWRFASARELRLAEGTSCMTAFWQLVRRDLAIAWKEGGTLGVTLGFYLVVVTMLPLGLGPDLNLLSRIAPGVLWVALLLAALLSLGRMFETDYEDGSLEVLATGPLPLEAVAAAKSLAHWLTTGVPLTVMAPVLGLLLNLPLEGYGVLVATMLGRHSGRQLHRRDRRGGDLARAARRDAAGAADAAAVRADAQFRHRGGESSPAGWGRLRCLIPAAVGGFPGVDRAGAAGGCGCAAVPAAVEARKRLQQCAQRPRSVPMQTTLTQRLANPTRFMALSGRLLPWIAGAAGVLIAFGLVPGLHGAAGLPAGPHRQDHVRARAGGLARHAGLHAGGGLELRPAGVPPPAGRRLRQGCGA